MQSRQAGSTRGAGQEAGRALSGQRLAFMILSGMFTPNAMKVLEARYLRRDPTGKIAEKPEQLFHRVASAVAAAELNWGGPAASEYWAERFYNVLSALDFLPNSPTLMNAGTDLGQLSACFVLPVEDSLEGIFDSLKQMALVQKTGGGTGFSFSHLRPQGDIVVSTGGESSGPVSFMKIFDCATEHIRQGGKRRGANMAVLRVDHPDILDFVRAKREPGVLENFNLSVGATDRFMEAVRKNEAYELIHPHTGRSVSRTSARGVFEAIVESAWLTGDPGLIFLDAVNAANPTPGLGAIEATNPCGEVPLLAFESCNLGSINLSHMTQSGADTPSIDWEKLRGIVPVAVRFLDDVVEVNRYPDPRFAAMARGNRKIGLGVMGFADLLIQLGVSYASEQALETGKLVMRAIAEEARSASRKLAEERGGFPNYRRSIYAATGEPIRNATRTSVAPTGTISILANTSASIEPLFAVAYRRTHVLSGATLTEVHPLFVSYLERQGLRSEPVIAEVLSKGRLAEVEGLPAEAKRLFVTALEIAPEHHLAMQAVFQESVDNAVSKTVNLPEEATKETIASAYQLAWERKLKGITVFRYGSKGSQVLELGADEAAYEREHFAKCDPHECRL
jgi:ribonucleoside-diphosphate reductase alpha chain